MTDADLFDLTLNFQGLATFFASMVAILAAYAGFRANRRQQRQQYTFDLHRGFTQDKALFLGHEIIERTFLRGEEIIDSDIADADTGESYYLYLSMCESIAYTYKRGFVEQRYIDDMVGHRLCKAYLVSGNYVSNRRASDPEYFVELENYVETSSKGRYYKKLYRSFKS